MRHLSEVWGSAITQNDGFHVPEPQGDGKFPHSASRLKHFNSR